MSYILDALRKADAQRERDPAARGIHAQPVRVVVGEPHPRERYGIWLWTATAAGLAALVSVGWYFYRDGAAEPVAPPVRAEVAAAAPAAAIAAPAAAVPADAVLPPPVVVVALPAPAPAPAAKPAESASAAVAKAKESMRSSPASAAAATRARPAPRQAASAPAAAPTAVADAAAPIAGLPADAPKLAISGGVYSANAAQRMLIVNGQVFNEGGEVGPGLVLEEIRAKAAVIRFRGARYTVAY